MATVRFLPLDVRNADFTQLARLRRAQTEHDTPQWPIWDSEVVRANIRGSNPAVEVENWIGTAGDRVIAFADMLLPRQDSGGNAHVEGIVHPAYRRHGIGSALLNLLRDRAVARGRTSLSTVAISPLPDGGMPRNGAGEAFCQGHELPEVLRLVRRRLDLSTVDRKRYARLAADCRRRARGYELLTWRDRAPADFAGDLAYLQDRMGTDSPRGDLAVDPIRHTAERWRGIEAMSLRRKKTVYFAAARHLDSGRLVAWTGMALQQRPRTHAMQQTTIVDPRHRGHRLGLAVKLANVAAARADEPRLRYIHTQNAESNSHMVAINDAMGFEACDVAVNYQAAIGRLLLCVYNRRWLR